MKNICVGVAAILVLCSGCSAVARHHRQRRQWPGHGDYWRPGAESGCRLYNLYKAAFLGFSVEWVVFNLDMRRCNPSTFCKDEKHV